MVVERGGVGQQHGRAALDRRADGARRVLGSAAGADQPRGFGVLARRRPCLGARDDRRVRAAAPFGPGAVIDRHVASARAGPGPGPGSAAVMPEPQVVTIGRCQVDARPRRTAARSSASASACRRRRRPRSKGRLRAPGMWPPRRPARGSAPRRGSGRPARASTTCAAPLARTPRTCVEVAHQVGSKPGVELAGRRLRPPVSTGRPSAHPLWQAAVQHEHVVVAHDAGRSTRPAAPRACRGVIDHDRSRRRRGPARRAARGEGLPASGSMCGRSAGVVGDRRRCRRTPRPGCGRSAYSARRVARRRPA